MYKHKEVNTMMRKLISAVMVIACLFMLVAGAFGIRDIMQEKSDGEKEKAATLESLIRSRRARRSLNRTEPTTRRAKPPTPMVRRLTRRARPIMQRASRILLRDSESTMPAKRLLHRARPIMQPEKRDLRPVRRNMTPA